MFNWKSLVASSLIVLAGTSMASAKDLCITDSYSGSWKFSKIKPLKPGRSVTLTGIREFSGSVFPASGSAYMRMDSTVDFAVTTVATAYALGNIVTWHVVSADAALAGTGSFDNTGEGTSDGPVTFTAADCTTLIFP